MRVVLGIGAVLMIAACEVTEPVEAKCRCFNASGESTGNCEFIAVAQGGAVFSFSGAQAQSAPVGGLCVAKE